jgi:hypothetical protein
MLEHKVRQGECISSISQKYGFKWDTVWNLPENAQLKKERENPNILFPGDIVHVPEKTKKQEACSTDSRSRFRMLGVPAYLEIRVTKEPEPEDEQESATISNVGAKDINVEDPQPGQSQQADEPQANTKYLLKIDGVVVKEGSTDSDGHIKASIPPDGKKGELVIEPGSDQETIIKLDLGGLNPISQISGVKQRLVNLGFDCGEINEQATPEFESALRAFQQKQGLEVTGQLDQRTKDTLLQLHGS